MINTFDLDVVNLFLKTCKSEINKKKCYFIGYRNLNINNKIISAKQALIDIGIMKEKDIWNYIKLLEAKDCFKIERDRDHFRDMNSEVYIFKKNINRKLVYIKLTINHKGLICISFHESY